MSATGGAIVIGYGLIGVIVTMVQWRFELLLARYTGKTWSGDPDFQGNLAVFFLWPVFLLLILAGDSDLEESDYAEKKKLVPPPEPWSLSVNPLGHKDVRVSINKRDGTNVSSLVIGDAPVADDDFDEKMKKLRQKAEGRISTLNALED